MSTTPQTTIPAPNPRKGDAASVSPDGQRLRSPHLRARDAATYLGIGVSTFWKWAKAGRLPKGVRLSTRCTIWPQSALDAFIAQNRKEA